MLNAPASPGFAIGDIDLQNNVMLAPMSGITDAPFRRLVENFGLGLSFSEMVASAELAGKSEDAARRLTRTDFAKPFAVQIAGRQTGLMVEAAIIAANNGADIIDINLGCPAKRVTGGMAGAALMRTPVKTIKLIEQVIKAVQIPVTVKMRLGWDEASRNAPQIARAAEDVGVKMICVHARTRQQFYKGAADWAYVSRVRQVTSVPLVVNGDILGIDDAISALARSGADGVMLGRGVLGRPWLPMQVATALGGGGRVDDPALDSQRQCVQDHYRAMLAHYGSLIGVKCARKHLGAYLDAAGDTFQIDVAKWRGLICRSTDANEVIELIDAFYEALELEQAA